ncbi:hypothetical protein STENM327S_03495 [Streptomyces tendae]
MRFSASCDGVERAVPDPRETRPLDMFVAAYEAMTGPEGLDLECRKPKRHLGRLGLVKRIRPPMEPSRASLLLDIDNLVHHVCLMRPAELVVTYRPGPKPPSENQGYAGVFRADEALDEVYAKAEPPNGTTLGTRSRWRDRESTFVQTTFRRIDEALDGLLSLEGVARPGASNVALGAASSLFSGLVAWGIGGATAYTTPGSESRSAQAAESGRGSSAGPARALSRSADSAASPTTELETSGTGSARNTSTAKTAHTRDAHAWAHVGDPYFDERGDVSVLVQEFHLPVSGLQRVRADLAVALPGTGGRETDGRSGRACPL